MVLLNKIKNKLRFNYRKKRFKESISKLDEILSSSKSGFVDPSVTNTGDIETGVGDIIFIPYMDRMNA